MSRRAERVVIVGNGVAGIEAALTLRAREPSWPVTIVSEESDHFFSRTALMWVATGQLSHRCIEPHERDLYARMDFRRVRARALGLDPERRELKLAGGLEPLRYDRLLIACGSRARPAPWPNAHLTGVGSFVTLQDLEWIERELHGGPSHAGGPPSADAHIAHSAEGSPYWPREDRRATRGGAPRHPVVIGGGLIGIEAVEVFLAAGLKPRFLIREDRFWQMALSKEEARWVAERLRGHGVDVHLEEEMEAFEGDDDSGLTAVRTNADRYEADLAVVSIGVVPNTEWLGDALELERGGVVVDEALRTSAEGVWAAGDCAAILQRDGSRRTEPLWYAARDQGRVAGDGLAGGSLPYESGVFYNSSKLADIEHTTVGSLDSEAPEAATFFFEERGRVKSTTRIVLRGDRVVGFNFLGRRWDHTVLIRFIEERRDLEHTLAHLNEARFDTELVPPLTIPDRAVDEWRRETPERG